MNHLSDLQIRASAVEAVSRSSRFIAYSSRTLDPSAELASIRGVGEYSGVEALRMESRSGEASRSSKQAHGLRAKLARKIALFMGSAEHRATGIPGLTLHRRTTLTDPCPATYEPSVIVIAQGRKRVDLGRTTFIYDASHFLLTSIDLPIVSRVIEASEASPCLALALKLEMSVVRELLSRMTA